MASTASSLVRGRQPSSRRALSLQIVLRLRTSGAAARSPGLNGAPSRTAQSGMTRVGTRRAPGVGAQAIAQEARDGRKAALLARGREEPLTGC